MAKRKRNYAAEYERRIASAATRGRTRQQARGHKPSEHKRPKAIQRERKRDRSTEGLRRTAVAKRLAELSSSGTKHPPNEKTIRQRFRLLKAAQLRAYLALVPGTYDPRDPAAMLEKLSGVYVSDNRGRGARAGGRGVDSFVGFTGAASADAGGDIDYYHSVYGSSAPDDDPGDFDFDWDVAMLEDDDGEIINPFWYN